MMSIELTELVIFVGRYFQKDLSFNRISSAAAETNKDSASHKSAFIWCIEPADPKVLDFFRLVISTATLSRKLSCVCNERSRGQEATHYYASS